MFGAVKSSKGIVLHVSGTMRLAHNNIQLALIDQCAAWMSILRSSQFSLLETGAMRVQARPMCMQGEI